MGMINMINWWRVIFFLYEPVLLKKIYQEFFEGTLETKNDNNKKENRFSTKLQALFQEITVLENTGK